MRLGSMDFEAMDFGARDENERDKSLVDIDPVNVILGIREELAEFRRNGGRQALLAKLRETREADLLATMQGPDPLGLDYVIEYLEERGVIHRRPVPGPKRRRRKAPGPGRGDGAVIHIADHRVAAEPSAERLTQEDQLVIRIRDQLRRD